MSEPDNKPGSPPQTAVALKYEGDGAPRVTATGKGKIAEKILEIARENDIPLHEDRDLVTLLSRLDLGDEIPVDLYVAVAQVLAFAYQVSGKDESMKEKIGRNISKKSATRSQNEAS